MTLPAEGKDGNRSSLHHPFCNMGKEIGDPGCICVVSYKCESDQKDREWAEKVKVGFGKCDECGTPYSYDPTDRGSICVRCQNEKITRLESALEEQHEATDKLHNERTRLESELKEAMELIEKLKSASYLYGECENTRVELLRTQADLNRANEALRIIDNSHYASVRHACKLSGNITAICPACALHTALNPEGKKEGAVEAK